MSFIDDIASRLVAQGAGVINVSIFRGSTALIPTGDGPYISITETGGTAPTRVHNMKIASTQRPTAQIVTRAKTYQVARSQARLAYLALDGVFNMVINGILYHQITARQEPTDIGKDESGRAMVAFNIDAQKQPS